MKHQLRTAYLFALAALMPASLIADELVATNALSTSGMKVVVCDSPLVAQGQMLNVTFECRGHTIAFDTAVSDLASAALKNDIAGLKAALEQQRQDYDTLSKRFDVLDQEVHGKVKTPASPLPPTAPK
jgi:hypothetical protein